MPNLSLLFVGAAIGAGLAWLLDSQRGGERRAMVRERMAQARDQMRDQAGNVSREMGELRGQIRRKWGELTDDEIAMAEGHWDEFVAAVKEKYGETEENIRSQIDAWRRAWESSRH